MIIDMVVRKRLRQGVGLCHRVRASSGVARENKTRTTHLPGVEIPRISSVVRAFTGRRARPNRARAPHHSETVGRPPPPLRDAPHRLL